MKFVRADILLQSPACLGRASELKRKPRVDQAVIMLIQFRIAELSPPFLLDFKMSSVINFNHNEGTSSRYRGRTDEAIEAPPPCNRCANCIVVAQVCDMFARMLQER